MMFTHSTIPSILLMYPSKTEIFMIHRFVLPYFLEWQLITNQDSMSTSSHWKRDEPVQLGLYALIVAHHVLKTIYFSLFYSCLIYGKTCWGNAVVVNRDRLMKLNERALPLALFRDRLKIPGIWQNLFLLLKMFSCIRKNH